MVTFFIFAELASLPTIVKQSQWEREYNTLIHQYFLQNLFISYIECVFTCINPVIS